MRKSLAISLAAVAAALAALAPGAWAALPNLGQLPAGWTHADINVTIGRVPHTLVVNRGVVQAASSSSLTLREADGSVVVVPVDASTQFVVNGQPGSVTSLRPGATATTEQIDGEPAARVSATVPLRLLAPAAAKLRKR